MATAKKLFQRITDDISQIRKKVSKFSSKKAVKELTEKFDQYKDSQAELIQTLQESQSKIVGDIKKTVESSSQELLNTQKLLLERISALNPIEAKATKKAAPKAAVTKIKAKPAAKKATPKATAKPAETKEAPKTAATKSDPKVS